MEHKITQMIKPNQIVRGCSGNKRLRINYIMIEQMI